MLLGVFFVFLYYLKEYVEKNFVTEENKKIFNHVDLLFVIPSFFSMILFAILLMQDNVTTQNRFLLIWIEFVILLFGPFVLIIVTAFLKSIFSFFKQKQEVMNHE